MESKLMDKEHRICVRCVMDTTDPDIEFDAQGLCNHCRGYQEKTSFYLRFGKEAEKQLQKAADEIKARGKNLEYDCLLGLSGGVDSSYAAYYAKKLNLRVLIVHLDNGWNSEISARNIENIVKKLDFGLYTYVIDWEEFRDLQLAFLKASVLDIEMLTDHAILAALLKVSKETGIHDILLGSNMISEAILPKSWRFAKWDSCNIKAIHRQFGQRPLKTFPFYGLYDLLAIQLFKHIRIFNILNYIPYDREQAMKILRLEIQWEYYGKKHHESVFTKFYQSYILPQKFGIDKRMAHFSSLICAGQMTRTQAVEELKKPLYDPLELREDTLYVMKKLGLTQEEFDDYMRRPPCSHLEYPNSQLVYNLLLNLRPLMITIFPGLRTIRI